MNRTSRLRKGAIFAMLGLIASLFGGNTAKADLRGALRAYANGNYEIALRELEKSAKAGDPQGLYNLGVLYAEGKAAQRDMAKAVELFREGAEKGSVLAAYSLAQVFRKGDGIPVDFAQAAHWFEFAAKRGDFRACNELGLLYVEGKGVKQDLVEGFAWIYPATHADIMDEKAFANAAQLARMLSPEQLSEAQSRGQDYHRRYIKPHQNVVRSLLEQ
jgi:TPR repeat protein